MAGIAFFANDNMRVHLYKPRYLSDTHGVRERISHARSAPAVLRCPFQASRTARLKTACQAVFLTARAFSGSNPLLI